jgi:hypothetical protein
MATDTRTAKPQGLPTPGVRGFEKSDAQPEWVFGVLIFLAISAVAIQLILSGVLNKMKQRPAPSDQWRPSERMPRSLPAKPSYPRLQVSPPADMATFRAREEATLNSYGWIDKTSGIVRVPIERAMSAVLQKGLPVRAGTNDGKTGPSPLQLQQSRPEQKGREIQGSP